MAPLVAGAALLGNWAMYKPVFYRLYYDEGKGKRGSLLALSRLGFFAVTAALAHKRGASDAILSIIAPLTLATIGKHKRSEVEGLLRSPLKLCSHIVKGLENSVSLVKAGVADRGGGEKRCEENVESRIIDVAILYNGEGRRIAIKGLASKGGCIREVKEKIEPGSEVLVVKRLQCSPQVCAEEEALTENSLPVVCRYECTLSYEVSSGGGEEHPPQEKNVDIEAYIVIVPVAMAQRLSDGTIVVFRERRAGLDMESVLRASILEGLATSLVRAVKEHSEEPGNEEVDITLFYDTTHGVNALLSPFSYAINIVNQLTVLGLTERLLKAYTSGKKFTYKVRAYLYNSDPVQLRERDELTHVLITLKSNISYYYRTFMDKSELSTGWRDIEGSEARRRLKGMLKSIVSVRSIIDELVSYLPPQGAGNEKGIENLATFYIQLMYLAKLGLAHWATAALVLDPQHGTTGALQPVITYELRSTDVSVEVAYVLNKQFTALPPHISVTSVLLGDRLAGYMLALYRALEGASPNRGKLCFRISTLENMLKDLDSKLSSSSSGTGEEASENKPARYEGPPLVASAIYTEIVEPSARTLALNELGKLREENLEKTLDHLLPRGFKLSIEKCPPPSEAWEEVLGAKVMCVYPMSPLPPKTSHVRNFIAHGGLTRLSKDWCLALLIEKENGSDSGKCTPYAICVERPLSKEIMSTIARPGQ